MVKILGCQNRTYVKQYLRQSILTCIMRLEPGFCGAQKKCILVCPDDSATPKDLTPFLTPPVNNDGKENKNPNLLKIVFQEK